jgi:rhamnogalacturonyl hydrolase YesR
MKTKISILFLSALVMCLSCSSPKEQEKWSVSTAKSFIERYPCADSIHWPGFPNHFSWQAGYIMFAMEKLWNATHDSAYFNYIRKYVDDQVDENGIVADFHNDALDNFLPGYAILFMYEQTHAEKYSIAATAIRHGFDNYPRTSDGLFWHAGWAKHQAWVDGVFMGQIFLARYGAVVGDSTYAFDEVAKQITLIAGHCQKENGLLLHGWDDSKSASWADKTTGLAPEVWSEGLGWYAVLMADVFDYFPKNHPEYQKLVEIHRRLCQGLKNAQDTKTGMWCQVVDKCNEPGNWNETSGTGMYMYLLQKSIEKGYIDKTEFSPVVEKAYHGIIKKAVVNQKGFIDLLDCSSIGIQNSYTDYINQPKEVSPFAAFGSFLIGTSIVEFEKK